MILPGTSWPQYTAIDAVNWSTLKHLAESPRHYRHALRADRAEEQTVALAKGSALHYAIFEPHRLDRDVAVWDGGRRGTNAYKAWLADNAGKLEIGADAAGEVRAMAAAVRSHPAAGPLLAAGEAEVAIRWTDPATGLRCKGRLDWLNEHADEGRILLVDLKSTRSTHPRRFAAQAARLGYHEQLAFYRRGLRALFGEDRPIDVAIIAVESAAPFDVVVYELDDDALYPGDESVSELLAKLAVCVEANHWPGRAEEPLRLDLPAWVFPGDDDEAAGLGITISGDAGEE